MSRQMMKESNYPQGHNFKHLCVYKKASKDMKQNL